MAPATEMLQLTLKPEADRTALIADIAKKLHGSPASGLLRAQYAFTVEDPLKLRLALDWEDVSSSSSSPSLSAQLPPSFLEATGALAEAPRGPYYVALEPPAPQVLDNRGGAGKAKVAELVHLYFPAEGDGRVGKEADVAEAMRGFEKEIRGAAPEGFSGEIALGWVVDGAAGAGLLEYKGEPSRAFVLVVGWDSVDAHVRFRDTEAFARIIPLLRGLEGLKGSDMCHVSFQAVEV
ncbi:hypothetical protein F5X99DRAFT_368900, partial [Biscogniauxia marginata]